MIKVWKHQLLLEFFFSKRTIGVLLIVGVYVFSAMAAASDCAIGLGVVSTPAGFVFLFNDFVCQTVLTVGFVFIMSSAPFVGSNVLYVAGRSGIRAWELGNMLYIVTAAFLYILFIVLASWLGLIRSLEPSADWGKLWRTLAQTSYGLSYELPFSVNPFLVGKYSASHATLSTFLLEWLCYSLIGMTVYLLSRHVNRILGLFAAGILVFLDTLIYNAGFTALYRFSPVTLSQLGRYTRELTDLGIREGRSYLCMAAAIGFMLVTGLICAPKEMDNEPN